MEYGQIRFDGRTLCKAARRIETRVLDAEGNTAAVGKKSAAYFTAYEIEAVRQKDHAMIRITNGKQTIHSIVAFPDSTRYFYLSLTGEHCTISSIHVDQDAGIVPEDYIPRIARLIWHCPLVTIFTLKDGKVGGEGYREFLLLRLDGENWDSDDHVVNTVEISHTGAFGGWNDWKAKNKAGLDCRVSIQREGNIVTIGTENLGVSISSVTTVKDEVDELYVALTGDECALTNIRITDGNKAEPEGKTIESCFSGFAMGRIRDRTFTGCDHTRAYT